jgi:ribosomal protein S8
MKLSEAKEKYLGVFKENNINAIFSEMSHTVGDDFQRFLSVTIPEKGNKKVINVLTSEGWIKDHRYNSNNMNYGAAEYVIRLKLEVSE